MIKDKSKKTIHDLRNNGIELLLQGNIPNSPLDCDLLLSHVLNQPRVFLYAHPEIFVSPRDVKTFFQLVKKRVSRIPCAYLTKAKFFYGHMFICQQPILVPREETELLVTQVLTFLKEKNPPPARLKLADIGTGSGCIPLSICCEWNTFSLECTLYDVSQKALTLARKNQQLFQKKNLISGRHIFRYKKISFIHIQEKYDVITANLPYLSKKEYITARRLYPEIQCENISALISTDDGLYHIKKLLGLLPYILNINGAAFFECSSRQEKKLITYIKNHLPRWKWFLIRCDSKKTSILRISRE